MPLTENIANGYLSLGIAGAALFIVLVSTVLSSSQNNKIINASNQKIDKLCDKIDALVTTITKDITSNDKDLKKINEKLEFISSVAVENQRRISRIDDRTYACLNNFSKKEVAENEHN